MKIVVFTTIKPEKKNLRIQYFEILFREMQKKIPVEIIWIVSQPDKFVNFKEKESTVYSIHDFRNGLDLLKKLQPDLVIVNIRKEIIQYSVSLVCKFLKIPLVGFTGAKIDYRKTEKLKKNRNFQNLFSNNLPTDSYSQHKLFRRGGYFLYKYLFLIKTKMSIKENFFQIFISIIVDFWIYALDKSLPFSTLPDIYLLHNDSQIPQFTKKGLDLKKMVVIGNLLLDEITKKIPIKNNLVPQSNNIRILIVTDSLFEHGIWSYEQREQFLRNLLKTLNKENNIEFSIKIHPVSENFEYYQQLISKLNIETKIFQSEDIWNLIFNYDIILSYGYSNAHTEISFSGKKLILLKTKIKFPTMDLIEEGKLSGHVIDCDNLEQLVPLINNFYKKIVNLTPIFKSEREKLFFKNDGKSAERGTNAILKLLNFSH